MRFRCLELTFAVDAEEPALEALVADLYIDCVADGEPAMRFAVRGTGPFSVYVEGEHVRTTTEPGLALAHLVWAVNRAVVETCSASLLLHAGAVERDGRAVLLSAASGAGKSTMTAALIAEGFAYLTDEAVAIDATTGLIQPYPKPIALGRQSWALFPDLPAGVARGGGEADERYVTGAALGATVGRASTVAMVVTPRYRRGANTAISPLGRADTLVALAEQSFNFQRFDADVFDLLAATVRECACFTLEYGDARDAARAVSRLFG